MITIVLVLSTTVLMVFVFVAKFRDGYLSELMLSFLPYIVVFGAVALLVATLAAGAPDGLETWSLIVSWGVLLLVSWPLVNFALFKRLSSASPKHNLRVATFNKLFTNNDTETIFYQLRHLEANVAGVLELTATQKQAMARLARHHDLHFISHRYSFSDSYIAFISRQPLQNVRFVPLGSIGVALVAQLNVRRISVTVVQVHTAAPIIPNMLRERNLGLEQLARLLVAFNNRRVVVMGDFNLTPWTRAYRRFSRALSNYYYNAGKGQGLRLTWSFFGPFGAHIDHIFASKEIKTKRLVTAGKHGSDHKLIYAELKI